MCHFSPPNDKGAAHLAAECDTLNVKQDMNFKMTIYIIQTRMIYLAKKEKKRIQTLIHYVMINVFPPYVSVLCDEMTVI